VCHKKKYKNKFRFVLVLNQLVFFIDAYSTAKFLFEQGSHRVPDFEIISQNGKMMNELIFYLQFRFYVQCKIIVRI